MPYCPQCGTEYASGQYRCAYCGAVLPSPVAQTTDYSQIPSYTSQRAPMEKPMKWYRFVVYFQLFASCTVNFLTALSVFTGSLYGLQKDMLLQACPTLTVINIVYGILLLGMCVLALVAREKLHGFYKVGPRLYMLHIFLQALLSLVYAILVTSATVQLEQVVAGLPDLFSAIAGFFGTCLLLVCNIQYFDRRKKLFTN